MLTLVAAAALVLPNAGEDFRRDIERDAPRELLETNLAGIWFQAFVDTEGRITECTVIGTLGESRSAQQACEAVKGRQITPARVDGKVSYGVYRGAMVLSDNDFDPDEIAFAPDVILEVQDLPGSTAGPVRTELTVLVEADGTISSCAFRGGRNSTFTEAACEQAKSIKMPVGKSASGQAVAYVFPLTYEFTESLASR